LIEPSPVWRRVAKGRRNPRRIRDAQLRTGFLTLQLPFVLLIRVLVVLTTVVLYAQAP